VSFLALSAYRKIVWTGPEVPENDLNQAPMKFRRGRLRVDFEAGNSWWERLKIAGFDPDQPAVVASTGVSLYLTKDAIAATLHQVAALAPGSTLAMTLILPLELAEPEERPGYEAAIKGARASGTPFISFLRRRRCWRSPATPVLEKPRTYQEPLWPNATSPTRQTALSLDLSVVVGV
jgi:O-methyltransferase involved in polyketide biosynthesis